VKKNIFIGLCLLSLSLSIAIRDASALDWRTNGSSREQDMDSTLGLVSGYLKGNSTYHISIYSGTSGVESELEFPLKTFLAGIEASFGSPASQKEDGFRVNIKWLKNIGDGSGKMKDSDWLTDDQDILLVGSPHPGKDIYSESDIDLSANIIDLNAVINMWHGKRGNIGPIFGYKYEKFDYNVSNTNQVGYGPYDPSFTAYVPGKTLDYEVTYNIFYAGLNTEILLSKTFHTNIMLAFSPQTTVADRDDHILRSKLSTGETTGHAYLAALNARWDASSQWSLEVGGEYMNIRTTGTQHQYFYAGPYAGLSGDVDDKITSTQWLVSAMITYKFPN
jgi:outer membrane protease